MCIFVFSPNTLDYLFYSNNINGKLLDLFICSVNGDLEGQISKNTELKLNGKSKIMR